MVFRLEHRFTQKNLSAYLDGQLTDSEKERLEHHLAECSQCQEELATLCSTVELLHAVPSVPLPRSFKLPASAEEERERYRFWSRTHKALRTATAVVSLLLVLLLSADLAIGQGIIPLPERPEAPRADEVALEMAEVPEERVHVPSPTPPEEEVEPEIGILESEPLPEAPEPPSTPATPAPETPTATPHRPPEPTPTVTPPHTETTPFSTWRIWRWLRTGWTALSGLLLVLVAGTLWTWHKRRRR